MYSDFNHQNRSPSRVFNNASTLNRQPSRQFENAYSAPSQQPVYGGEDFGRYDNGRGFDRMNAAASTLQNNSYQYDNQTWNYGGVNGGANTIGGTGRAKNAPRRAAIPSVSNSPFTAD